LHRCAEWLARESARSPLIVHSMVFCSKWLSKSSSTPSLNAKRAGFCPIPSHRPVQTNAVIVASAFQHPAMKLTRVITLQGFDSSLGRPWTVDVVLSQPDLLREHGVN